MALLSRHVLLLLLSCFMFLTYNGYEVIGAVSRSSNEDDDDLEIEKQLKLLKKPAVKTIQTEHGILYDCVDFYKQPGFDHPLLQNHTFHDKMRPSSLPKIQKKEFDSTINTETIEVKPKRVGCPVGTVPIRRVTKDDLIRAKLHKEKYGSKYNALNTDNAYTKHAVVKTQPSPTTKYTGGGVGISLYTPSLYSLSQYSSARMKVQNGDDSIEYGWTVNPTLYGDANTYFYIYLNAGPSRCFNLQCPGFILVNSDYPIDDRQDDVSKRGGQIYYMGFKIFRDEPVGNWWLLYGEGQVQVGFWPSRIFTSLSGMATSVEWGGVVSSPPGAGLPQMGSGLWPNGPNTGLHAFCKTITTINEDHQVVDATGTTVEDTPPYVVKDLGMRKGKYLRHIMFFGGPK